MNKRKLSAVIGTVSLLAVVAVGTTIALLNDTTETAKNTFSSNKEISISLREPKWDGYTFEDATVEIPDEEVPLAATPKADSEYPNGASTENENAALGIHMASSYLPGDAIPKNPIVMNTTDKEPVYVAVTVECLNENNESMSYDPEFINHYGTIAFTEQWVPIGSKGNAMIYLYGSKQTDTTWKATSLAAGTVTSKPVFDSVNLNLTIGEDDTMPQFHVQVKAYAIQASNVEDSDAANYLKDFIGAD